MRQAGRVLKAIRRLGEVLDCDHDKQTGQFGLAAIIFRHAALLRVIASNGMGWDHVSVSLEDRCPTWGEMCFIKDLFWRTSETVMQLHPTEADYVNEHPFALHLWKPQGVKILMPPKVMV